MSAARAAADDTPLTRIPRCGDEEDTMIRELAQSGIDPAFGFWAIVTAVLVGGGITIARRGNASNHR